MSRSKVAAWGVFLILFASEAYFRHSRDWNTASRLMLTYALVDRSTLSINGLENQTGDKAVQSGRYYSDKMPGYSLLAAVPYLVAKTVFRLPDHPLNEPGFAYWPADYWITLLTSGLCTAATGALLVVFAGKLGCGPNRSALIGLSYGLATPAALYGALAYGHQVSAFLLLASFGVLRKGPGDRALLRSILAGFCASYAAVVELQVGPVSAVLGFYLIALIVGGRWPIQAIWSFGIGALVPALVLVLYNYLAFGSPWTMGYFLHANPRFRGVHGSGNPLGIGKPAWHLADDLLWGTRRGLLWYAPILLLVVPGLIALGRARHWAMLAVSSLVMLVVFVVNLSYPEWTGGWSTGPRLLVPLLPFAMLPVAALLGTTNHRAWTWLATVLYLVGFVVILLFEGVGGRIPEQAFGPGLPDPFSFPLRDVVWPLWRGDPLPGWLYGIRFSQNLTSLVVPGQVAALSAGRQWIQFLPLVIVQSLATAILMWLLRTKPRVQAAPVTKLDRSEVASSRA